MLWHRRPFPSPAPQRTYARFPEQASSYYNEIEIERGDSARLGSAVRFPGQIGPDKFNRARQVYISKSTCRLARSFDDNGIATAVTARRCARVPGEAMVGPPSN